MRRIGIAVLGVMRLAWIAAAFIGKQIYFVKEESPQRLLRTETEHRSAVHGVRLQGQVIRAK